MIKECRLCGSSNLKLLEKIGPEKQYGYYRCKNCKLVNYDLAGGVDQNKYENDFVDPALSDHSINQHQTESYNFLKKFRKSGSLLEIGFGNGRILYLAGRDGFEVSGLELSSYLVDSASKNLKIPVMQGDFLSSSPFGDKQWDIIVLRHVLEHFSDSIKVMQRLNGLLSSEGIVLLEFPNIDSWELVFKRFQRRHNLHKKRYSKTFMPGHCNEFCRSSFELLLQKTGFKLISWTTYSHKPLVNAIYNIFPIGNKVRTLIKKV